MPTATGNNSPVRLLILLLFLLSMAGTPALSAAPVTGRFHHLPGIEELRQGHVSNIQQDDRGMMWFATWNGLLRYDGYNVSNYSPIRCSDGAIDSDRVYNIKFSTTGDIWCVSSDNRLFLFSPSAGKFINLSAEIPGIAGRSVKQLTPLKSGVTWAVFHDGSALRMTDRDPVASSRFFPASEEVRGVRLGAGGAEWILRADNAFDLTSGRSVKGKFAFSETVAGQDFFISRDGAVADSRGRRFGALAGRNLKVNYVRPGESQLILATDRGIFGVSASDGSVTEFSTLPSNYLYKDSRGRIWALSGDEGVILIDGARVAVMSAPKAAKPTKIKNPQLIFETPQGDVVVKTDGGVLSGYDEAEQELRPVEMAAEEEFGPGEIKKFTVDMSGNVWVLRPESVECMSFSRKIFSRHDNAAGAESRALLVDSRGRRWITDRTGRVACDGFSFRAAAAPYVIRESPSGEIWVGTKGAGVYRLRPSGGPHLYNVKHLTRGHGIHSDSIYAISFSGPKVWLGSYGSGIASLTLRGDETQLTVPSNLPPGMKVRSILPARGGVLLVGTTDGLVVTDTCGSRYFVNRYRTGENALKGNDIMSLVECDGDYYATVYGAGLSRIASDNLMTDSLSFIPVELPQSAGSERIKSAADSGGEIWIVSGSALTRLRPATGQIRTYPSALLENAIFSECAPAVGKGSVLLGTSSGYIELNIDNEVVAESPRRFVVSGIMYQNDMRIHPLDNPTEIVITPSQRSFSLMLSAVDYDAESTTAIRYRLVGHDDGWNYVRSGRPAITYSNLPPGDYELVAEAENVSGQWSAMPGKVMIRVVPRFTETVAFRLIIIALAIGLVLLLVCLTLYFMRMRDALQKKYSLLLTVDNISDRLDAEAAENARRIAADRRKERFIEESLKFIDANIANSELVVEDLARNLGMSRTAYYNMMKETTGLAPVDFIRQVRIKRALKFLAMNRYTVAEVAYMVGFSDPKYFSRCFKAETSMTPSEYIRHLRPATTSPANADDNT